MTEEAGETVHAAMVDVDEDIGDVNPWIVQ
jgi:hypothetical protein